MATKQTAAEKLAALKGEDTPAAAPAPKPPKAPKAPKPPKSVKAPAEVGAPKAPRKEREMGAKQKAILEVLTTKAVEMTPSEIGQECGLAKGSPAADWAFPAIKTLVLKGLVEKAGPGKYKVVVRPS